MNDIGQPPVWRMRALTLAKGMRADDPRLTSLALADAIIAEVEGAPARRDPVLQRIRSWERTGVIAARQRSTAA